MSDTNKDQRHILDGMNQLIEKKKHLNKSSFAKMVGVSKALITKFSNGGQVSISSLIPMAKTLRDYKEVLKKDTYAHVCKFLEEYDKESNYAKERTDYDKLRDWLLEQPDLAIAVFLQFVSGERRRSEEDIVQACGRKGLVYLNEMLKKGWLVYEDGYYRPNLDNWVMTGNKGHHRFLHVLIDQIPWHLHHREDVPRGGATFKVKMLNQEGFQKIQGILAKARKDFLEITENPKYNESTEKNDPLIATFMAAFMGPLNPDD